MLAISFAVMGARDLSFLSCRAYLVQGHVSQCIQQAIFVRRKALEVDLREARDHSSYPAGRSCFTCRYHNQQLHDAVVDLARSCALEDED